MSKKGPQDIHDTFSTQWLVQAEHLFECAQLVQDHYIEQRQAMMAEQKASSKVFQVRTGRDARLLYGFGQYLLVGLALELMFKAVWMHRQGSIVQKVPGFWKQSGHKLTMLAEDIGFQLTNEEQDYLTDLTEVIIWQGKYPVDFKRLDRAPWTSSKFSWGLYVDLFERLKEAFKAAGEDRKKGNP
jgi:hypothetical protein